jgi:class 3 adenylate cyclase
MAASPGWGRVDRWTLRFVDPGLERSYDLADQAAEIQRLRTSSLTAIVVWVLVALIGPPALGISPGPTYVICAAMTVVLLACAGLASRATTRRRRDALGLGQQLAAGVAVLILTDTTGTFAIYAMPGIMLTAVFGFSVARHPFVGAVLVGAAYWLLFVAFAAVVRLGPQLPLQAMLVAATVVASWIGAYELERSQRLSFAQAQLIASLHERVDRLLHQYLSPDVASTLVADPARSALGGEELVVTVLFADLRGYTSFAERTSPAEVVAMLNAAYGAAVPVILAEGGTVAQFVGDALMAIFNAPNAQPDHALRAARAGLAMQSAVEALPGAAARPRFRIGINTGPALVGNVGSDEIRNFSAIGDTTNLAARLQTFADEGTVVLGAATYGLIRDKVIVRPLGAPALRGKSVEVEVYELIGLREPVGAGRPDGSAVQGEADAPGAPAPPPPPPAGATLAAGGGLSVTIGVGVGSGVGTGVGSGVGASLGGAEGSSLTDGAAVSTALPDGSAARGGDADAAADADALGRGVPPQSDKPPPSPAQVAPNGSNPGS